jgi:hypothetical protein
MMARTANRPPSGAASSGVPIIKENLKIAIRDGRIYSARLTPNEQPDTNNCLFPEDDQLLDYTTALAITHGLTARPDAEKRQRIRDLRRPLCVSLLKAVPKAVRERIAEAARTRQLVAIEISLIDEALEKYPWELIGEPGVICRSARRVAVWRKPVSQGERPQPKRWQNSILLTGSASMRHASPYIEQELAAIELELRSAAIEVHSNSQLVPNALEPLLEGERPRAFHLAAHGTSESLQLQGRPGPTLEELDIDPKFVGAALGDSDVVVGVFSCCNSAAVPYGGGLPGAYHIAKLAEASVVGMSSIIHPYVAIIFAQGFYACLAAGGSALQAYHQGITRIRNHKIYSSMWSVPVMYSRDADVIPFPVGDEARARLSYQHIQSELEVLDGELAELAQMNFRDPAEWFEHTSTPAIRMECISSFLPGLAAISCRNVIDAAQDEEEVRRAQEDLQHALDCALAALDMLGAHECGAAQRKSAFGELYLFRRRHPRILRRLGQEFEDAR